MLCMVYTAWVEYTFVPMPGLGTSVWFGRSQRTNPGTLVCQIEVPCFLINFWGCEPALVADWEPGCRSLTLGVGGLIKGRRGRQEVWTPVVSCDSTDPSIQIRLRFRAVPPNDFLVFLGVRNGCKYFYSRIHWSVADLG